MNSESPSLNRDLTSLKGVGAKLAEKLSRIGLETVLDLLFHLPYRYQDRTRIAPLGGLHHGMAVAVDVRVTGSQVVFGRRRSMVVRVQDNTGSLTLRFFHFSAAQKNQLATGARLLCFGEIRRGPSGYEMVHPEYSLLAESARFEAEQTLTPWYPTTEGIQQTRMRDLVNQSLNDLPELKDWLPEALLAERNLPGLQSAVLMLHHPPSSEPVDVFLSGQHPSQQRLALEELLAHHLSLRKKRQHEMIEQAPVLGREISIATRVEAQLGFQLTSAQLRVLSEIRSDLMKPFPMARLVQGDVGAGKTLVALLAGLQAVESRFQFAMMAPTEILAEQHFQNIQAWLNPFGIRVVCLTGKQAKGIQSANLQAIASGDAQVIIGTHALFQERVQFHNLAFIVIDEQHRFGVEQRLLLKNKAVHNGWTPHQLFMTATPIPRTLAQSMYADLDYSQIDELPPGRQGIITRVISQQRREDIIGRVDNATREHKQVYWVCTLIEESEELQCQAAEDTLAMLRYSLPDCRIGLIHGRLKSTEKNQVMSSFKQGDLDVLVATTVIEVGVDVPNATVMIIENPERLGLSQLHQLRGRIGRGHQQSFCLLVYGETLSDVGRQRLEVMRRTQDGFEIAEMDLKLRGPGEILGVRQTGLQQFKVADLQRDQFLLPDIQLMADTIVAQYPEIIEPLTQRWLNRNEKYAHI